MVIGVIVLSQANYHRLYLYLFTGQFQNYPPPSPPPPPAQTPRPLTFLNNFIHIPRYVAGLDGEIPYQLQIQRRSNPLLKCTYSVINNWLTQDHQT